MENRRIPPQQIEAEMSVLGAVFVENACLKKVSNMIDGADFFRESHRKIYHAMLQMQLKNAPIDYVGMLASLKAEGFLEEVGGGAYLAMLAEYVPFAGNVAHYCKLVKEASIRRQLIQYGQSMIDFGFGNDDIGEGLKDAKADLGSIMECTDSIGGVSLSDITTVEDRAARYAFQAQTLDQKRFITGFALLDHYIRGVAPGEVMTIIAEPGGFKTAWLQNLLLRGSKRTGLHHLFFSLEMPVEKVFEREVQILAGCTGKQVESVYKHSLDAKREAAIKIYNEIRQEGSKGLLVCDKPRLDIDKVARYTELAAAKFGKINAIGIDYLGLMAGPGKTLYDKMAFIAPEFKHLAKEMGIPVIILCQINREGAKNVHDILITDAKGGGDIEASADIMLGFYHDAQGTLVCKILKNRNGANGVKLAVDINKEHFQFNNITEYEEPELEKPKKQTGAVGRGRFSKGGLPT